MKTRHNAERRAWKGRSYKKGGEQVRAVKEAEKAEADLKRERASHVGCTEDCCRP